MTRLSAVRPNAKAATGHQALICVYYACIGKNNALLSGESALLAATLLQTELGACVRPDAVHTGCAAESGADPSERKRRGSRLVTGFAQGPGGGAAATGGCGATLVSTSGLKCELG